MELQHTAAVERRTPDWLVAAVAGLAGGAAVMLLDLLWSVIVHDVSPLVSASSPGSAKNPMSSTASGWFWASSPSRKVRIG